MREISSQGCQKLLLHLGEFSGISCDYKGKAGWPKILIKQQGALSCATARPSVAASTGALTLAGSPSIRSFIAKLVLSRFTRFCVYKFQPQHTLFCREMGFVANYPYP